MSDDSRLDELFQAYGRACPEVEASANFMPNLWRRIEARHSFGFVFRNVARAAMTACAALCLLLALLNFAPAFGERAAPIANYTDALMAEHSAENTDFTEALHASNYEREAAPAVQRH